jgi:hypothetical protein
LGPGQGRSFLHLHLTPSKLNPAHSSGDGTAGAPGGEEQQAGEKAADTKGGKATNKGKKKKKGKADALCVNEGAEFVQRMYSSPSCFPFSLSVCLSAHRSVCLSVCLPAITPCWLSDFVALLFMFYLLLLLAFRLVSSPYRFSSSLINEIHRACVFDRQR